MTSCAQDDTTTYYLIRHAEKDRTNKSNKNPDLNIKGKERAENWAVYFNDIDFDAVYSTKYNRTIQTATPTAKNNNLTLQYYNPSKMFSAEFQKATKGKTVLIVGHSNTTPFFVNKIINEKKYIEIDDSDNSKLFIVNVSKNSVKSEVLTVN